MRILDVDEIGPIDRAALEDRLVPGETLEQAYRSSGSTILFTDRRIVVVQLQMLISERVETSSWPYRAMRQLSVTEGAEGEHRYELRIWVGAEPHPIHLRANPGADLTGLHALLVARLA